MAVESVLKELNIDYINVELGKAELKSILSPEEQKKLNFALKYYELELMDDRKKIIVERIKNVIIEIFTSADLDMRLKFSEYLSKTIHYDYTYLSNIYSEIEGSTIERFYIVSKIDRVKQLIVYEKLSLKEIAYNLNYSSVSHLSLQFKKVTGQTISNFKKLCESQDYVWKTCE